MADNETEHAPNVEELFGSEDEDDDYNPSLDVGEEQPEAAPQSKHERMQALANRKRREQEAEAEEAARRKRRRSTEEVDEAPHVDTQDLFGEEDDEDEAPAPIDQEFDGEGQVTDADRNFIDDTGVDDEDAVAYGAGEEDHLVYQEEAEEGDEFERMMEERRKRRNKGMSDLETREFVESLLDRLDTAREVDKEALKAKRPAIAKLRALPAFEDAVARPQLHRWLLDAGILAVFNNWLYPHEDGTLPNIKLRTTLLKMLVRMNLDTSLEHRRDQLKTSNLGKVIMFYAKLQDETPSNRRLAAQLVERWSKPVYEQFTRRDSDVERHEEAARMRELKRRQAVEEEDKAKVGYNPDAKPGERGFRWHARVPQAARLDYIRKPQSDPLLAGQAALPRGTRPAQPAKLEKKLKVLKSKKNTGRAANVSVEGRGLMM